LWPKTVSKSFCGWAWMGIWNPNSRWVVDDDKLWSGYSSSRSVDTQSLVSCVLFYIWVLFVCCYDFLWSGGNALVLVMEQFPCCIGDGLYGHVYHIFGCWLVLWFWGRLEGRGWRKVINGRRKRRCHSHSHGES
jgi:hypothetical protein